MTSDVKGSTGSRDHVSPSTPSTTTPSARRRHKQILKCSQCRLDKQKCTPIDRVWPNRCERCIRYNHTCSPGLNARDERRRQAPSTYPMHVRSPTSSQEPQIEGSTQGMRSQFAGDLHSYTRRIPSPGTASSTGSEDDQPDYQGGYDRGMSENMETEVRAPDDEQLPVMAILHSGSQVQSVEARANPGMEINHTYLNCLPRNSALQVAATTGKEIYPVQPTSNAMGFNYPPSQYSAYYPSSNTDTSFSRSELSLRARPLIIHTLYTRFLHFWVQLSPLTRVFPQSPGLTSVIHNIFAYQVLQLAQSDDMVNHALIAFSAADAGISACGEWGRRVKITAFKHAGKCQRMLLQRLEKLRLGGDATVGGVRGELTQNGEVTVVQLSIFLMLFYGLCMSDSGLLQVTTQLLADSKNYISTSRGPTAPSSHLNWWSFPIGATYTSLANGRWRVHLFLDRQIVHGGPEEPGLEIGNDTIMFDDIRREYEEQHAPPPPDVGQLGLDQEDDEDYDKSPAQMARNTSPSLVTPTPTPTRISTPSGITSASPSMGLADINFTALSGGININPNLHLNANDYTTNLAGNNSTENIQNTSSNPNSKNIGSNTTHIYGNTSLHPPLAYAPHIHPPIMSQTYPEDGKPTYYREVPVNEHHNGQPMYIPPSHENILMTTYPPPLQVSIQNAHPGGVYMHLQNAGRSGNAALSNITARAAGHLTRSHIHPNQQYREHNLH